MEVRDRIQETALRMFRTYGTKSVTMFDISRECGVSKKTIYEHFEDKEALVNEVIRFLIDGHQAFLNNCRVEAENAIVEMVESMKYTEQLARSLNPVMLYEIQKYHPATWQVVEQFKANAILENIRENLNRGMTEGLYRNNLSTDVIARMRQLQLESAFDPLQFPADRFNLHEVMFQVTAHFILGIATLRGHKLVYQYLQIKEDE